MLRAFRLLLLDLAATLIFLAAVLLTGNVQLAIVAGMLFGAGQIGLELARKHPIGAMQWLSLLLRPSRLSICRDAFHRDPPPRSRRSASGGVRSRGLLNSLQPQARRNSVSSIRPFWLRMPPA